MEAKSVLVSYVVPGLGLVVANAMFTTPLLAVLAVRKKQDLGDLNPLPFPVILANCCSWLAYGLNTPDWFLYFGNLPGTLLGLYFVTSTLVYATPKMRRSLEALLLVLVFDNLAVAGGLSLLEASTETKKFLWGLNSNVLLMMYYGAPLSVIASVFRNRSSSPLYWPTCAANFANGALWFSYGLFAVNDYWLYVPNGIGAMLAAFQLLLCAFFPRIPVNDTAVARDPTSYASMLQHADSSSELNLHELTMLQSKEPSAA